jgi:hypothetical protein
MGCRCMEVYRRTLLGVAGSQLPIIGTGIPVGTTQGAIGADGVLPNDAGQIDAMKVDAGQHGSTQIGATEVGEAEIGPCQIAPAQGSTRQIGMTQIATPPTTVYGVDCGGWG